MTAPNMAAITASLERSFHKCSLYNHQLSSDQHQNQNHNPHLHSLLHSSSSSSSSSSNNYSHSTVDLNSHLSLPCHWEQCLDLKTGEIYYINLRNGMRANEDPRMVRQDYVNGDYYYSSEEEEEEEEEDSSSCDSEESSSESSPCSSREHYSSSSGSNNNKSNNNKVEEEEGDGENENVLVVAGCKRCLMYFMLPKQVEDCPKCCSAHLLHFDTSDTNTNTTNASSH